MPKGLFIVGTDTNVGKTYIACKIAEAFKRRGLKVGVFKPFESGVGSGHEDFRLLKEASGTAAPDHWINPYRFEEALAPAVAAKRASVSIDWCSVTDCFESIAIKNDFTIVEGAGGLLVPLAEGKNNIDLIRECEFPVLLVARLGLGTINHTLLSLEALKNRSIPCVGVVLNQATPDFGVAEETNAEILSSLGVDVLTTVRFGTAPEDAFCALLSQRLA